MEKTITTKEAVALLSVLNAFPCDFLDSAAFIQNYTTFRIAVRDVAKKFTDLVMADQKVMNDALAPLREEGAALSNAKAELDSKPDLSTEEAALAEKYRKQLEALSIRGEFIVKQFNEKYDKLIEEHGKKKLLLICNEEDYSKVKAKILEKAKDIFKGGVDGKLFDIDRYEIILNIFK